MGAVLLAIAGEFTAYAVRAAEYPYGLDYCEGLLWQQALWLLSPHAYGSIEHYPYMIYEYPPIYLAIIKWAGWMGFDMLAAGRVVSIVSTYVSAALIFVVVRRVCHAACGAFASAIGGVVAALLPFGLLPILSWAVLMRVDLLALAFTWAGLALATAALRKPVLLYPAMLVFVVAVFTKQVFIAAPICVSFVWLVRASRLMLRAGTLAAATGVLATGALQLATHGGFLRHVVLYTAFPLDLGRAAWAILSWLAAYPIFSATTLAAILVVGYATLSPLTLRTLRHVHAAIRDNDRVANFALFFLYIALSTFSLISAGKTGASRNYFIEWMCLWCVWIGWLSAICVHATQNRAQSFAILRLFLPFCFCCSFGRYQARCRRCDANSSRQRMRAMPPPFSPAHTC